MQILIFFLSALAVVFAGAALILVVEERHHNREFVAAVDQRFKGMAKANKDSKVALRQYVDHGIKKTSDRIDKAIVAVRAVNKKAEEAKKASVDNADRIKKNSDHISDLENGIVPDFETARKAVDEVNKFNEGIAGILGFDPLEAMKKGRQEDD